MDIIYGVALGPYTFTYMCPMLADTFKVALANIFYSLTLVLFFEIVHFFVIAFDRTFIEIVKKYLKWADKSKEVYVIKNMHFIAFYCCTLPDIFVICIKN